MLYYRESVETTLKDQAVELHHGLAASEVQERIKLHGLNIVKVKTEPLWRKIVEPFANIFMAVLFLAATLSAFRHEFVDAGIILAIILTSATIYYIQRFSTERILRSLKKHTEQSVEVRRNGTIGSIDSTLLVPGDIIILREGEKVPADARIAVAQAVRADESLLTGESMPINKGSEALRGTKEVYEQSNMLFQGSFIIDGEATCIVVATGSETQFGQIAALAGEPKMQSPVQAKIDTLLSQIIAVVAGLAVIAFILSLQNGMDLTESIRFVMALSVSAVPESLPVAISVILVLGMRRMAARKAFVRTMRSIETVGVITTIATDKTGTLTRNKLSVQEVWMPADVSQARFDQVLSWSINHVESKNRDPLDTTIEEYGRQKKILAAKSKPIRSLPFDIDYAMSGNIWHRGHEYELFVKGAPEHVIARAHLTENEKEEATTALHHLTSLGYRVIALAETRLTAEPQRFSDVPKKASFEFLGFIAIADILRPEARRAVLAAQAAGVSVRMITGDHFETAFHIGRTLGMVKNREQVFDCRHMDVLSDDEMDNVIEKTHVFSRVTPQHKYRILSLLKRHNITAMTGDGVNDVPALAGAHVGVAMGSGAQIARDAGDIILLDDNFKSIINAMREGRIIFSNIRRMLFYLLSTNAGEAITMISALILGLPVPLVPVQILWINLVTDTSMVIPIGLEPGSSTTMKQKPRSPSAPILSKFMVSRTVLVALTMATLTISLYAFFASRYGHDYGNTIAFSALVVMQWANAFNARSDYESLFKRIRTWSTPFYIGLGIAISLQALAIFGPLQGLLHITTVAVGDLFITGLLAFTVPIILVEIHKYVGRRYFNKG